MPNNRTKTILIFFLALDLFLVIIFSGLFLYMKRENIDTSDKENQIKSEIKKQESRSLMQDDLRESKSYRDTLKGYLVNQEDIVGFIEILEDMVSSSGLKSEVKSVSSESNDSLAIINSEYVRIKVDVTGEWNNIQYFLDLLENYPLKIEIDKVFLTKFSDYEVKGKDMPQWLGSFEFTVLKLKDNK